MNEEKIMKKKMTKDTKVKPYTKEQIAYFQAQSDMGDGVVNDIQDIDYIDHLLGGVHNSYDGLTMDTSFEDLDDSSDWFMDWFTSSSGDVKVGFESRTLESW